MKIIGHRGAAGLALENTEQSIRAASAVGVDGIEFDIRLTSDNKFVLCHDVTFRRVSNSTLNIRKETLATLLKVKLHNGETPLTLDKALAVCGSTPVLIEAKSNGWALPLARLLKGRDPAKTIVIARDHEELELFHNLLPQFKIYLVQRFNPIDVFQTLHDARRLKFTGVDINFWLLNPVTYWLARRYKLEIIVYTVNSPWMASFLSRLFPYISITTNHPHVMQFLRSDEDTTS